MTVRVGNRPVHAVKPERVKPKRSARGGQGWLETEGSECSQQDAGRPVRNRHSARVNGDSGRSSTIGPVRVPRWVSGSEHTNAHPTNRRRTGVRASIVAVKPGNSGGAKGRRKVEHVTNGEPNDHSGKCRKAIPPRDPPVSDRCTTMNRQVRVVDDPGASRLRSVGAWKVDRAVFHPLAG